MTTPNLAHVYTKIGSDHRHFELPRDGEKFHAWIAESRVTAARESTYELHRDIVLGHLARMSDANAEGTYPVIAWADDAWAPVIVEYHRLTTAHLQNPESAGPGCWRCGGPLADTGDAPGNDDPSNN